MHAGSSQPRHRPDAAGDSFLLLDESGTASFPSSGATSDPARFFVLCACLFRRDALRAITTALEEFKQRHLGDLGVVLVSRQIRKREGRFTFLNDPALRIPFLEGLTEVVRAAEFTAFCAVIDKPRLRLDQPASASLAYELALMFISERVAMGHPRTLGGQVHVVGEARGRREDGLLRLEYDRRLREGTRYVAAARFARCFGPDLNFVRKTENHPGLQIADLVAYPVYQKLSNPSAFNPAWEVVRPKLARAKDGRVWGVGLKVFSAGVEASEFGL